jgi:hypothetical protein
LFARRPRDGERSRGRTGELSVVSTATNSPHVVALTATGVPSQLTLTPDPLSFGNVQVGTPSATQFVTVRNTGVGPVQVNSFTASGDFSVVTVGVVNCSLTTPLPAGAICSLAVHVTASAAGARTGELTVVSTATNSPHVVALTATGVPSQLTLTPNPLSFGNVQVGTPSATQFVTVRNTGAGPVQVNSFTASGDYSVVTVGVVNCSLTTPLPASAICSIAMRVTPSAAGPLSGTLTVSSTAANSPQTVDLLANGVLSVTGVAAQSVDRPVVATGAATIAASPPGNANINAIAQVGAAPNRGVLSSAARPVLVTLNVAKRPLDE